MSIRIRGRLGLALVVCAAVSGTAQSADLVRGVRFKISAGDLKSAEAQVEDYKLKTGADAEYLNAVGWLARGAEMLRRPDLAALYVAELRQAIPSEKPDLVVPYGAAIEVEAKLRAAREGRGSALRFLDDELSRAKDPALRSRIRKNMNLLSLEGQPAPDIAFTSAAGKPARRLSELKGKPVLLFFWAHWCGDCKDQAPALKRLAEKYEPRGVAFVAPTRLYGTGAENKEVPPEEEKAHLAKVFSEHYPSMEVPIDTDAMVRYGVSGTPTLALVDRKGIVRMYTPTRVTEAELSRRIEELLAETP